MLKWFTLLVILAAVYSTATSSHTPCPEEPKCELFYETDSNGEGRQVMRCRN